MLTPIADGLWCAEHDVRMPGGAIFRARMTVADLGGDELLLHSPVPLDDEMAGEIAQHGRVRWIVAPNDHHHLFAGDAAARFPEAKVLGTAGACENEPEVDFDGLLEEGAPDEWAGRLEMVHLAGTRKWNEFVFFLPQKRTFLCSDLVFNIHDIPNFATHVLLFVAGARRKFAQSRLERWFLVADRDKFADSMVDVLAWDFERVIMAHGRIVEAGGHKMLTEAVSWAFREPHRKRLSA